jgi:hypothetical protein
MWAIIFINSLLHQYYIRILQYASGENPHRNTKKIICTNMEKLNLQNVSRETLERKYFELLDIQKELRDYQHEIENVLFLPF